MKTDLLWLISIWLAYYAWCCGEFLNSPFFLDNSQKIFEKKSFKPILKSLSTRLIGSILIQKKLSNVTFYFWYQIWKYLIFFKINFSSYDLMKAFYQKKQDFKFYVFLRSLKLPSLIEFFYFWKFQSNWTRPVQVLTVINRVVKSVLLIQIFILLLSFIQLITVLIKNCILIL